MGGALYFRGNAIFFPPDFDGAKKNRISFELPEAPADRSTNAHPLTTDQDHCKGVIFETSFGSWLGVTGASDAPFRAPFLTFLFEPEMEYGKLRCVRKNTSSPLVREEQGYSCE